MEVQGSQNLRRESAGTEVAIGSEEGNLRAYGALFTVFNPRLNLSRCCLVSFGDKVRDCSPLVVSWSCSTAAVRFESSVVHCFNDGNAADRHFSQGRDGLEAFDARDMAWRA